MAWLLNDHLCFCPSHPDAGRLEAMGGRAKRSFATAAEARGFLARTGRKGRAYRCACGRFHLTAGARPERGRH